MARITFDLEKELKKKRGEEVEEELRPTNMAIRLSPNDAGAMIIYNNGKLTRFFNLDESQIRMLKWVATIIETDANEF
jgi:hypothetical protein